VAESLITTEQQLPVDDDKQKEKDDDGKENEETNSMQDHPALSAAEGYSDDIAISNEVMINGDDVEEGEIVDDEDDSKQYSRDFLLSLQFLDQCKQRPPNLQNAEYIRKVLAVNMLIVDLNCWYLGANETVRDEIRLSSRALF